MLNKLLFSRARILSLIKDIKITLGWWVRVLYFFQLSFL